MSRESPPPSHTECVGAVLWEHGLSV
uniref:Uncharacterized protein n=1 Tax=Arundo donax TaxID=35708 RepID=A0A0A8Z5X6_ARUDO